MSAFHDLLLDDCGGDPAAPPRPAADSLWHWIERNHLCNMRLWEAEDQARATDRPAPEIVQCKRSIDRHNQARNDAVEAIDLCLLACLGDPPPAPQARPHSETPGAMIDRLSILSLKVHHMRREARRAEAGAGHMQTCAARLERLCLQRDDLRGCLDQLLHDLAGGRAWFRLYRQFKMYNDPTLNPVLYRRPDRAPSA